MNDDNKGTNSGRRHFLKSGLGFGLLAGAAYGLSSVTLSSRILAAGDTEKFEITRSDAEWQQLLSPQQYEILRKHGTERPFTSPLLDEKRPGHFHCAGCDLAVYDNKTKYDSGTGWPSFYEALPDAVGTQSDRSWFVERTEVHCRRGGGHFGHIFDDGPQPTGMRHCINGLSLTFKAA